jgi:hypothetical protein
MEAGQVQGVVPLVQTRVEKVRVIRLTASQYNLLRSFVESSLKEEYEWRMALEFPGYYEWRKEGKWELEVYKYNNNVLSNVVKLPVNGIFKITDRMIQPEVVLKSLRTDAEIWFVLIKPNMIGVNELGIFYDDTVKLVFTRRAPIMFTPKTPIPFSRPIPIYEVFETLDYYFTL